MDDQWKEAQKGEAAFWRNCANTFAEEKKQLEIYAPRLLLNPIPNTYYFDLHGKTVMDIGSGPASLLLKCINVEGYAVDPLMDTFPSWVRARYAHAGITSLSKKGEDLTVIPSRPKFDEVWIYNVLQHVQDPERVIKIAKTLGKVLRLFEWVDVPTDQEHIHTLRAAELDKWLDTEGLTEDIPDPNCFGHAYYSVIRL